MKMFGMRIEKTYLLGGASIILGVGYLFYTLYLYINQALHPDRLYLYRYVLTEALFDWALSALLIYGGLLLLLKTQTNRLHIILAYFAFIILLGVKLFLW